MPEQRVNGAKLFYELNGSGDSLVLVHGSWVDHKDWQLVVPHLARSFRVLTYDRRGHSLSERPLGQGSRREDEEDLAALMEALAPLHPPTSPQTLLVGRSRLPRRRAFAETQFPANHILGNSEGIKRAGAVRETPADHTTVRGVVVFLLHTSERLPRTFRYPLLRKVAEKTHHSPVCPPLQRTSPPHPAPSG